MSLRKQIFFLPLATAVIVLTISMLGMVYVGRQNLAAVYDKERQVAEASLRVALDAKQTQALALAQLLAGLKTVQKAVAENDDALLEERFLEPFNELKALVGLKQMHFHTPPATSLIRLHQLDQRGDDLSEFRQTVVDANTNSAAVKGLERGRFGVGARGIAPILYQGQHVGTIEVGFDMDQVFLDTMAAETGNNYEYYVVPSSVVDSTSGAESGGVTRMATTLQQAELLSKEQISRLVQGETIDFLIEIDGVTQVGRAVTVLDFAGKIVGIYTITTPNRLAASLARMEWTVMAISTTLAIVLGGLVAWFYSARLIGQIASVARATGQIAAGEADVVIAGTERRDEIGDMARALEVFAATQREAERMQDALREEEENARQAEAARRAQEAEAEALRAAQEAEAQALRQQLEAEEHEAQRRRAAEAQARLDEQARVVSVLAEGLEAMAAGDLARPIAEALPGDYERLRLNFNATITQLAAALQAITASAARIDGEAVAIARANEDLSQNTERNAATLEQTAAALNQLTVSVRSAAEGASAARDLAAGARSDAESGVAVVNQAVDAMSQIEGSAQSISRITGVIDDIAFQTNLLALNAGVEAARAGEAGRGFAVVASEVRALAQRSSEAAKEISTLIASSDQQVRSGVALVSQTGAALAKIVNSVRDISDRVTEIAVSAGEQAGGIAEINAAVNQLDRTTQQTAAMFDRTADSSRALVQESAGLIDAVRIFRLEAETRPAAPPHQSFAAE